MRVALIATCTHPIALGIRYISGYMKAHGHNVETFFMRSKRDTAEADFTPAIRDELVERLRPVDLIGMSLMTNTFHRACVLTDTIRKAAVKAPIVWGGIHPTAAADESLEVVETVCIGEGEEAMLEYAQRLEAGQDPTTTESFAFRRNGRTVRNPVRPLQADLDRLPFPDYEGSTQWVAMHDHFEPARPGNLRGALNRYRIETTRGCPYSCTFCTNAVMLGVYKDKGPWVRLRSNENIIAEIEAIRGRFPTVEAVNVVDDLFFVRSEAEIDQFSRMYEARVNLPIELDAFPNTISRGKVRSLARLPISLVSMGIQSGSYDTLKNLYNRRTPIETIVEGIDILADHKLRAEYHYLVNNPFETDDSRIETLRFAASHHRRPAVLRVFPLQFYPGTPLYHRARAEGLITDRHDSAYRYTYTGKTHLLDSGYLDIWLRVVLNLRNIGCPRALAHALITFVTHPVVRRLLDRRWFAPVAYGAYRTGRFIWRKLIFQPFIRPIWYLTSRRGRVQPPGNEGGTLPHRPIPPVSNADPVRAAKA